jgi:hypothetical protein
MNEATPHLTLGLATDASELVLQAYLPPREAPLLAYSVSLAELAEWSAPAARFVGTLVLAALHPHVPALQHYPALLRDWDGPTPRHARLEAARARPSHLLVQVLGAPDRIVVQRRHHPDAATPCTLRLAELALRGPELGSTALGVTLLRALGALHPDLPDLTLRRP